MIILETGPSTYVGGPFTLTQGYGETKNKNLAICFGTVDEAMEWIAETGRDAAMVDFETLEFIA